MRKVILAFLKKRTTIIGIGAAFMFQVIFSLVWMTGYDGVTDHIENLSIAIVNDDVTIESTLIEQLESNIPLNVMTLDSINQAKELLNQREIHMVVHLPERFSEQLQSPRPVSIHYIINESNPLMLKSVMERVSDNITKSVNQIAINKGVQTVLSELQLPIEHVFMYSLSLSERVVSQVETINPVTNFSNQMIPLMIVIASFVGAMVMGMNLYQSAEAIKGEIGRWQRYVGWGIINVVSSLLIALVGSSLIIGLGGHVEQGFLAMWGFQTLFMVSFLFFAQIFLLLFGMLGMLFNIMMLSLQLITSGAMVPRELLSSLYYKIGKFLPATYAVEGNMNLLFGGPEQITVVTSLCVFILSSIAIGVLIVTIKKDKESEVTSNPNVEMVK